MAFNPELFKQLLRVKHRNQALAILFKVIAIVAAVAVAGVGGYTVYQSIANQPDAHEHEFSAEWSSDETNHWHAAICEDGEECASATADLAEHTFEEGACSVCGYADPTYVPECTEHAPGAPEVIKPATCTEAGERKFTCTVCGYSWTQEIAPEGHDEVTLEGKAPTCTEPGLSSGKQCSVCGEITKAQLEVNPIGHSFVEGACTVCGEFDPEYTGPRTYVLGVQSMEEIAQGDKADGDTATFGNFFTIYYSAKFKLDGSNKTFDDGFSGSKRLNWGGGTDLTTAVKDSEGNVIGEVIKNAIEFEVPEGYTASVKVWWVCGGTYTNADGVEVPRQVAIYAPDESLVVASDLELAKNATGISEFTLEEAGKYYLGNLGNTNYFFEVQVVLTPVEEGPATEGSINVTTTDNNWFADKVTFTATESGKYTFTIPVGVGAVDAYGYDYEPWTTLPYFDPMDPRVDPAELLLPHSFSVDIAAGDTYEFYISAPLKNETYVITWSFVAGEVEGGDDPIDPPTIDYPLNANGNNGVNAEDINYVFTADSEGTLTLQFGNAIMAPVAFSYTLNGGDAIAVELGSTVTLDLVAGDKIVITVVAEGYSSITASFSGEQGGGDDPIDPTESDLVIGENSVTLTENDLENGVDLTFVVTVEDTYTFECDYLLAIIYDSNGMQVGRGQASLAVGVYTVKFVPFEGAGTFTVNIYGSTTEPDVPTEPDGSYENPFVIETFPYTGTANITGEWGGTVYYTFTATADGYITVTVTGGDSTEWLAINGTSASTLKYPVLAGNTYSVQIYNDHAVSHDVSIDFEAATLTADDYKAIINDTAANDADYNWSVSFSKTDDGIYYANVADGMWTSSYYYSYSVVFNADGSVSVTLLEVLDLSALWMDNVGDEYVLANNYTLLLTPGEWGYTLEFVEGEAEEEPLKFVVAGSAGFFGSSWSLEDANNLLVYENGIYTIVYENTPVGLYEFKVVDITNGYNWGIEYPTSNYKFFVEAGSKVVISIKDGALTVEVYAPGSETATDGTNYTFYMVVGDSGLCGDILNTEAEGWGWELENFANLLTLNADGKYEIVYTGVAAGSYGIKVVKNASWDEQWGDNGNNYMINVASDNSIVTITFDPATGISYKVEAPHEHSYLYPCDAHCQECGELTNPNAAHNIVHVEAKAGTDCQTYNGNVEYWTCSDCGYAWLDEALTQQTNRMNVVVPGEHSYFYSCDKVCQVCLEETNPNATHTIAHVEAVAATCYENGNIEYWYCEACGYAWADEALTQQTNMMSIVTPMAHAPATHVEAVAATCTEDGNIEYWYCEACGQAWLDEACTLNTNLKSVILPALGHTDANYDGKCETCGKYFLPEAGVSFKLQLVQANLGKTLYFTGKMDGYYYATGDYNAAVDVYIEEADGGFNMYFLEGETKKYLYVIASGTYINVKIGTSNEGNLWSFNEQYGSLVTVVNGTDYYIGTYNSFNTISASKTSYVNASNVNVSQFIARAIVIPEHEHVYSEATCTKLATCSVCALTTGSLLDHSYGEGVETAPTCTADGFTTYTCVNCSATKKEAGEAALGHTTESGVCENCGENIGGEVENPALSNATLSFSDKANRTSFSSSQQVWEQNGVKVTNNKAASSSNVADYAKPARFYASSQIIVEGAGMTKIAFTCNSSTYATNLKNSIGTVSGATVTVSGSVVTVVFETAVDSFNIAKLTAQVRMDSITVNG